MESSHGWFGERKMIWLEWDCGGKLSKTGVGDIKVYMGCHSQRNGGPFFGETVACIFDLHDNQCLRRCSIHLYDNTNRSIPIGTLA